MLIKKTNRYRWRMQSTGFEKVRYKHISFDTTYWFLGIPIYTTEKFVENKAIASESEFDLEEGGFKNPEVKVRSVYNPNIDEGLKMEGKVEGSFE